MKTITALLCGAMTLVPLSLVACGGHVAVDGGGDDGGTDTGVIVPDGGCVPGTSWTVGCNTCYCGTDGSVTCSELPCPPPPPPPPDGGTCPSSIPVSGVPCLGEGMRCSYATCPDGSPNVDAYCKGGVWSVSTGPCAMPGCPPSEPTIGSPCSAAAGKCMYSNSCGGHDYLYCDGSRWQAAGSDCPPPPPPPPTCPPYEPPIGSYCGTTPLKCAYPNSCGGTDGVYCPGTGAGWTLAGSGCTTPTCPTIEPAAGTSCPSPGAMKCDYKNACGGDDLLDCAPWGAWQLDGSSCSGTTCPISPPITGSSCAGYPGGTTCNYPPFGYCPQPCVCGSDGRWTCYDVLCDAGPPPPPPPSGCSDGVPCSPGSGCAEACVRSCSCGSDGVFHCTPIACVDAGGV